jgi:glycine/D-amino acid oxidase-like deaminating enzyme
MSDRETVAVIGAGIIGVQIARALQVAGRKVTIFDPLDPGMATSFGNAGYLAIDEIFPLAHGTVLRRLPSMLLNPLGPLAMRWQEFPRLLPWYLQYARACSATRSQRSVATLASIQSLAIAAWQRVVKRDGLQKLVIGNGAVTVFESDAGFERTRTQRQIQRRYGIAWQAYTGAEARHRIPELADSVRHMVLFPDGHHVVNPHSVTNTIFNKFVGDGGEFKKQGVNALLNDAQNALSLRVDDEVAYFDQTVVCSGYKSGRLLKPLGLKVPIVAERGYHVEMSHRETRLAMPVGSHERGFYVTPMSSGLRLAGTTEFSSADDDAPPTWARADILKRHVSEFMPGLAEAETGRWMGHRPTLPDFLPVLSKTSHSPSLYLAFGHHHLGLTQSAVTAEVMTSLMLGEDNDLDITPFSISRFQ